MQAKTGIEKRCGLGSFFHRFWVPKWNQHRYTMMMIKMALRSENGRYEHGRHHGFAAPEGGPTLLYGA